MGYTFSIPFGTIIAVISYMIGRGALRRGLGEDSEALSSGRRRYFVAQVGELILAVISSLIAIVVTAFAAFIVTAFN